MKTRSRLHYSILTAGIVYILIGVAIFAAPQWFFHNIGEFPPFNRHYMGDVASSLLPYGIGLVIAARDVARHRIVIGLAGAASILHLFNHLYDAIGGVTHSHWLVDLTPLVLLAWPLVAVYSRRKPGGQADQTDGSPSTI